MQAAARTYVMAAAALAATGGLVGVTPKLPQQPQQPAIHVASPAVRLVDVVSGVDAIPFNLFDDILDIPGNEVNAFNEFGTSLMSGGTWLVSSATNLWGEDPGDPDRFMALTQILIPFSAISGEGSPEPGFGNFDWADSASGQLGLSQQISLLLDAELPTSASSDATNSVPLDPVSPITGFTGLDRAIWSGEIFTNQTPYPLVDNWFQTPLSDLTSGTYNFGTVVDPSEGAGVDGQVPQDDVFGTAGTTPEYVIPGDPASGVVENANGNVVQLMPWSNEPFTLNLAYPFENFFSANPGGLEAPVDTSTFLSDINLPTGEELFQAFQTFVAGSVISFDPFIPGSPLCDPVCTDLPNSLSMPALVQDIENWDPANTDIQHWLNLYNTPATGEDGLPNPYGMTADPTQEQINFANITNGQGEFDIGNPQTTDPIAGTETPITFGESQSIQDLQAFMQDSGIYNLVEEYAASQGYTPIPYSTDADLFLQPTTSTATGAASDAVAANAFDPTSFGADLSAILGSTAASDLTQMLANELPQLLGTQLSTDLLSAF